MSKAQTKTGDSNQSKIRLFLTGLTMGIADLIPGVSGGTIAFLFGIYDELLYTIKIMTGQVPRLLLAGHFRKALSLIPFGFLLPLATGLIVAIFGLAQLITFLLSNYRVEVWSLFFGLVLGSSFIISKRITHWNMARIFLLLLGFGLTFLIVGLPSVGGNESPLAIFATGVIAITAMILPGISGSLIMVLLGQYEIIITAITERNFPVLGVFAAGAIIGLALFVRFLTWLLKHYHMAVIAFLIGVMAGSLRRIWPWQDVSAQGVPSNIPPPLEPSLLLALLLLAAGFGIVFFLERIGIAREHDDIDTREFKKELREIEGQ